jgi:hypothetical protein
VSAADNRGRQEVNKGRKSDWGAAPEHAPQHRPQAAGSLPPTAGPPELYAALASEAGLESTGEHAHETELARSEPIVLINAAAPLSSNSLKKPSLEERATKFVSSQIAGWSAASTNDLGSLASAYADNVLYYGSRKSRQAIVLEKSREVERWPKRVYDVQRDSMVVQCVANLCKLRGIMAWHMHNAHRTTLANGISKFEYEITSSDDGFRILSESGSVVERYRQKDGRNHSQRIKVTVRQHRYNGRITGDESPLHDQSASNPMASIGLRHPLALSGGPSDLLVSHKLIPKTSSALPSNVVGAGVRAV